jgi:hypothetical protein
LAKSASSSQSQSQSQAGRASSSQVASSSTSQASRATPRVIPPSEFPTTPTPPTRRQSSGRYSEYRDNEDEEREEVSLQAGPSDLSQPSRTLKRTASKAALQQPPSPATKLLTTPKKRPYTGPIHDPNPINPFAASPLRRSAIKNSDTSIQPQAQSQSSPFFHATSPMKLKELLQENSLRKVQERNGTSPVKEITPRTKARKRLTGEIEETPAKSRVRRKRGAGPMAESSMLAPGMNGLSKSSTNGEDVAELHDGDEEDDFGPTPIKATRQQEAFHSFFDMDNGAAAGPSRGTLSRTGSSDMVGRLLAAGGKGKGKASNGKAPVTNGNGHVNDDIVLSSPTGLGTTDDIEASVDNTDNPGAELPPWDEDIEVPGPSKSKPASRPDKTLSISDDELDEWDPEASHVRHRVRIVPTRARPKKHWSDSDNDSIPDQDDQAESVDSEEELPPLDDTTTSQTNPSVQSPPQLLSLLSLTSPNQRQGRYAKLKELRYKALFNPSGTDAMKLKAFQKGQEAFVAGEAEDEDEEEIVEVEEEGQGVRADDDWESESDGWNRTGVEMDDDAW